jgi:hypothetical protein
MGFFIEAERRLVNRIGIGVEHFKRFSDSDRFSLWRSLFIIMTCFAASFAFGLDLVSASQETTMPTTVYEVHQYDELQAAKVTIEDLREQIKEINADRRQMHDKNEQWKQDM